MTDPREPLVVPLRTGAQVGRWLRGLRVQAGLTQTQLSERTGVSQRYVSELERGRTDLTISRLFLVAGALGASLHGSAQDPEQDPEHDPDQA